MKTLHVCNVNFEWELENRSKMGVKDSFMVHPNYLQLQFLPFLYAKPGDGVVVTHHPPEVPEGIAVHLFEDEIEGYDRIETWGWSKAIERWSPLPYKVPDCLREVASKAFSFTHSPNLPGAKLLHHPEEAKGWIAEGPYPKVLKTCYGMAGRRRIILEKPEDYEKAQAQVLKEFERGHQLIGEPWVNRQMDFSTQWVLGDEITYLGATVLENTKWGNYSRTYVGQDIPFLEEHLEKVQSPLKHLWARGFRGNLGIDAMVYDNKLHPIVEINTRKTMGWLALKLGKSLAYENGTQGLLPSFLMTDKKIPFQKQLVLL
ncbi:hypothetical protein [Candidatus Neptunochlamydia vexilliferae]|uniref:ATP-grasp domain-containing protein n=1 Tax=Candidatus Neptunichlamydia vexilliferae TaxID=1651774 RepID=A0ABS0AX56_9BACT|nr:hypothetical protein [Candidatus Neptunochlamydia vexilliferae]MBF5058722.1 hypothetical protein [Candidatus Neptunochlamydia vexilliferae]